MPASLRIFVVIVLLVTVLPHPLGSAPADTANNPGFTFRKSVQEVRVAFQVQQANGSILTPIMRDDIVVLEDGQPVSTITAFQHSNDLPLEVAVLVDASDSMRGNFSQEMQQAQKTVQQIIRPGVDHVTLTTFALQRSQGQTNMTRRAEGQTALYDTLYETAQEMPRRTAARRIILLFSDGEDNWSRHNFDDAMSAILRAEITILAVTVHSRRLEFPGDRILRTMAESTGGYCFILSQYQNADKVLPAILNEMRSQYVVMFRPHSADLAGTFHSVKVAPRTRKLKIRARSGYYADGWTTAETQ